MVQGSRPYMLRPENEHEAAHGKAILLTDTDLSTLMTVMQGFRADTPDQEEAVDRLWRKAMRAWGEKPPYEVGVA